jgi:uncharacterized membrane protein
MKQFSITEALGFGWETWKSNALLWIGIMIVTVIIESIPSVPSGAVQDQLALSLILSLVLLAIHTVIQIGLVKVSLGFVDSGRADFADLFNGYPLFFNFLFASIIFGVMFGIGLVLLIVPGIIVAVIFGLYSYPIVDQGLGPIEALQRSAALTQGVRMDLFLFGLVLLGLNILGAIACLVGLLVTIPMSMMAGAYVYRRLDQQTPRLGQGGFQATEPRL